MEILQINKFGLLHDGDRIFFSETDRLPYVFEEIKRIDHEVILISGNGDTHVGFYASDDELYKRSNEIFTNPPKNIKYWFAQNNITKKENIIPLPIGIQNSFGIPPWSTGYDWIDPNILKHIYEEDTTVPTGDFYLNYCNRPGHRKKMTELCLEYLDVTYDEYPVKYDVYIKGILNHEATFCPTGMAVDTFRLFEVLYCKRIPITVKVGTYGIDYSIDKEDEVSWTGTPFCPPQENEYPIYTDLYSQLPVVMLENMDELKDAEHLKELVEKQKNKEWDRNLLDFVFWKERILKLKNQLR